MEVLTFEGLLKAVPEIIKGQNELKALLLQRGAPQNEIETPIQLNELEALTGLTKPTLYGKVQRNEIPYHKKNSRLYFFKSEIIDWIKEGRQKTSKEVVSETDSYLSSKNKSVLKTK